MVLYYGQAVEADDGDIGLFLGVITPDEENEPEIYAEVKDFTEPCVIVIYDNAREKFKLLYIEMDDLTAITNSDHSLTIFKTPHNKAVRPEYGMFKITYTEALKNFLNKLSTEKAKESA